MQVSTTFQDVLRVLHQLIDENTIIVGHSLDNDLRVLRLIHRRVIDTAAIFPHPNGLPYKHSLKRLAKDHLKKAVQETAGAVLDAILACYR